jgi:hypothetical protein
LPTERVETIWQEISSNGITGSPSGGLQPPGR